VGTGAKIAIGCGIALVVSVVALVGVVGFGAFWVKGKVDELAGEQKKISEYETRAASHSFTAPADGVIAEDRLLKFLEVRKQVFDVYEKHKDEIEAMQHKKQGDFGDVRKTFAFINDIRLAQAKAQAEVGMNPAEYAFLVTQVYKTAWASEVAKSTGGKTASEAAQEAGENAAREMEKAAEEGSEGLPDSSREAMRQSAKDIRTQTKEAGEQLQALDVPAENLALFRKYETEIRKYAMTGLEWLPL
jgi:hypothetical protein